MLWNSKQQKDGYLFHFMFGTIPKCFFPRRLSLHRFGLESGGCKLLQLIVEVTFSAVVVIVIDGSVVFNGQVAEEGVSFS